MRSTSLPIWSRWARTTIWVANSEILQIGGRAVRMIGLEDLMRIKRHLGRPKDRESLLHLEAIKRLREEEGLR